MESPEVLDCPQCGGCGCKACDNEGTFELTECPYASYLDGDVRDAIQMAEMFKRGLPPVQGGLLDQPAWFVDWSRLWWRDQDRLKPLRMELE